MAEQGCTFRHGKHLVGYNDLGACALPHHEELCMGTRHAIIRTLLRMGLTVAVLTFGALVVLRLLAG